ncbi:hypothetical protein QEH52_18975 [Coraliomargarita sp. SDUM461003]|uniref:FTP domain-containing protein n=1 Tax=Thalassobacterium maritimum TaxID=3041265 RepID=A0ABU1AZM6_9BACT|nr:hypothetical protein [Coraliomargarita sp. SDUM461003]MDQ8209610.1 hypothetical protein [Coraliomargarita sp. SDUM461003]
MGKKLIAYLLLSSLLSITAYSGYLSYVEEFKPKHTLVPVEETSKENQEYVEFLNSIYFEETSFPAIKFFTFIDRVSRVVISDGVVSFSKSKDSEKRIDIKVLHPEAFAADNVNFQSRKISYLQAIDVACGEVRAVWTIDNGQIYIMPTKMKFEIRNNPPSINPFDS